MESGTFSKVANVTIHQHTDRLIYHLLCTVEWLNLQDIQMLHVISFYLPSMEHFCENAWNFYKCPGTFLLSVYKVGLMYSKAGRVMTWEGSILAY